jgi:hypothetical protein
MWGAVETECVDGKQQNGLVTATFAGADVGVPFSATAFTMELSDSSPGMGDLQNLNGFARVFSLSGALGGGISISNMILGDAETDGVDVGGQLGFDLGAIGMSGWSHVFSISETDCGCQE